MARRGRFRQAARPGGLRTQRYPEFAPEDRGETTDRLEARRTADSDWLDACDQVDARIDPDDEALPQRRRLRTHGDLVYEVALSIEIARKLEGRAGLLRRSHPSLWVADSRLFGFRDPLPERRARALEADGALRTHRLRDGLRDLPRIGLDACARIVDEACDRRDLSDIGGLTVAEAQAVGRVRYGPPLDAVFLASGTDPVLLSAAGALARQASSRSRLGEHLDRAAQAVALRHVDLCVRDPYRAAAAERRWAAGREGLGLESLDPGGANFGAWFRRTRAVAEVHYAVGLDPVREPLPRAAVEAVLACGGPLPEGVRAVGGAGRDCHRVARAVQAGFSAVRRLDSWMTAAPRTVAGVMAPILARAGSSWPAPDRAAVLERYPLAEAPAEAPARPSAPAAEPPPPAADLYLDGRPFAGARWPAGGPGRLPLPAAEALAVHAWRRQAGVDADVVLDEAEAVHLGGAVGPGVRGVVVPARRGGEERALYPAEAVGVAPARGDAGLKSVDQAVVGLGVRVAVHSSPAAAYRLSEDLLAVPEDRSEPAAYASAVALALAAATGHPSREGRRDAGAPRESLGWVREQLRCDLAAARIAGALGLPYEPPRELALPAEARKVFARHGADLCRDADRMSSMVIARGRGVELEGGYRSAWPAVGVDPAPPVVPVVPVAPLPPAAPERSR